MKPVVTASEMRAVEAAAERAGVSTAVLMERAGEGLARVARQCAPQARRFVVACGPGNNGGDGFVAARHLKAAGGDVAVLCAVDSASLRGEPARHAALAADAGISFHGPGDVISRGDVVIDAIFGTGLSRAPTGLQAEAISRVRSWRQTGALVVAADLPSGMQADDGRCYEPCVEADVTVCFGLLKPCHATYPGLARCGRVEVVELDLPVAARSVLTATTARLVELDDVLVRLPPLAIDAHKGSAGHLLLIAGSEGKTGAAALAARGALRGGAGLVTLAARAPALAGSMLFSPEAMGLSVRGTGPLAIGDLDALKAACAGKDAVVIGPGVEPGTALVDVLGALLASVSLPVVLDAEGLNAVAAKPEVLERASGPVVITPHPGEMARLVKASASAVNADRLRVARSFAEAFGVVVVLKGARTVVAIPTGATFINPTGNAGMATGGTGDVLAGLCGALLAGGLSAEDAALVSVYAHGAAGDAAAEKFGQRGLRASDVAEGLGDVWRTWRR